MVAKPRLALITDPAENKAASCKPELGSALTRAIRSEEAFRHHANQAVADLHGRGTLLNGMPRLLEPTMASEWIFVGCDPQSVRPLEYRLSLGDYFARQRVKIRAYQREGYPIKEARSQRTVPAFEHVDGICDSCDS